MNPHIQRARLLLSQSKYQLAEDELRQALADDTTNAEAHALLALCLVERKEYQQATEEAQQAIAAEPDEALGFRAMSHVMFHRNRLNEAREAIDNAIRIQPWESSHYSQLAAICFQQSQWQEALNAAEQGLECDAEDVECTNYRAMALVKLGRREEASTTIDAALANEPDNAITHANQGWAFLDNREPDKAAEHFREALRLDPTLEWARVGIIEAMKAKHFIYRWMLAFFLWMGKLPPKWQFGLIIGLLFGNIILQQVCQAVPVLEPVQAPLALAYLLFVWMSWSASTLFNLVLCFSRFGRQILTPRDRLAATLAGVCILLAIGVSVFSNQFLRSYHYWCSGAILFMVLPIAGTIHAKESRRGFFLLYTLGLTACLVMSLFELYQIPAAIKAFVAKHPDGLDEKQTWEFTFETMQGFFRWFNYTKFGLIFFTWIGLGDGMVEERK